jgi:hypothetical protein
MSVFVLHAKAPIEWVSMYPYPSTKILSSNGQKLSGLVIEENSTSSHFLNQMKILGKISWMKWPQDAKIHRQNLMAKK